MDLQANGEPDVIPFASQALINPASFALVARCYTLPTQAKMTSTELALSIIQHNPDGVMAFSTSYRIDFWNTTMEKIFGKLAKDVLDQNLFDLFPLLRETGQDKKLERVLKGELSDFRHSFEAPAGSRFYEGHHLPLVDAGGMIIGGYTIIRDITQFKNLEQFAFTASHDLQEPLRMIYSYLQLLEENYKETLDPKALRYVDIAVDGAKRMQALIRDLLTYTRLDSDRTGHEATDCKTILEAVLTDLRVMIEESRAQITSGFLPTVIANSSQLRMLIQNLISNAIKFRRPDENPRIRIFAEKQDKDWLFGVEDNGIGIALDDQERIFRIFQRLHERSRYPGTGIGLSLCQKIVEQHDGKIWAESQPGQGSTFFFTLPVKIAKAAN